MNRALNVVLVVAAGAAMVAVVCSAVFAAGEARPADAAKPAAAKPIKVLILVGGHGYDTKNFAKAWSGHDDIACEVYKDSKKPFTAFDDANSFQYDVILMYTLAGGMTDKQKANLLALLKKGVGLVVWHHALGNCQDWPEFEKIAGGRYWMRAGQRPDGTKVPASGFRHGVDLKMHVADANHPITKGMKDFEIHDETYNRQTFTRDIRVLVSTDNPASDKPIAWVSNYPVGRVFSYQGGHDATAWTNPGHRRLLAQGIRWAAGRLK